MTHIQKLEVLLQDDRLADNEREAFHDMQLAIQNGVRATLSRPQAKWVDDVYGRLGLADEEASQNLWSRGKVPVGIVEPPRHFELMPKPLRPPGR